MEYSGDVLWSCASANIAQISNSLVVPLGRISILHPVYRTERHVYYGIIMLCIDAGFILRIVERKEMEHLFNRNAGGKWGV